MWSPPSCGGIFLPLLDSNLLHYSYILRVFWLGQSILMGPRGLVLSDSGSLRQVKSQQSKLKKYSESKKLCNEALVMLGKPLRSPFLPYRRTLLYVLCTQISRDRHENPTITINVARISPEVFRTAVNTGNRQMLSIINTLELDCPTCCRMHRTMYIYNACPSLDLLHCQRWTGENSPNSGFYPSILQNFSAASQEIANRKETFELDRANLASLITQTRSAPDFGVAM